MNRCRTSSLLPLTLLVVVGLVLGGCGDSSGTAPTDPVGTDATSNSGPSTTVDPIVAIRGVALAEGTTERVVLTRDLLVEQFGIRGGFDATALALALGYDADQLHEAVVAGHLAADGRILDEAGSEAPPNLPPTTVLTAGPMGIRSAAARPASTPTLEALWDESKNTFGQLMGATLPQEHPAYWNLFNLEVLVALAAMGFTLDEVVGYGLLGVLPDCARVRQTNAVQHIVERACPDGDAGRAANAADPSSSSTTSTSIPPNSADVDPDGPTAEQPDDPSADQSDSGSLPDDDIFAGTVDLSIGILNPVVETSDLLLLVGDVGLNGELEYRARGSDESGTYCIEVTAVLDDALVPLVEADRYEGTIGVDVTHWGGDCGTGEPTPNRLELGITATVSGDEITGTLIAPGGDVPYTARRGGLAS